MNRFRTICTVCGSPPCPDLNLIHYNWHRQYLNKRSQFIDYVKTKGSNFLRLFDCSPYLQPEPSQQQRTCRV
ncbi:hypothetical protein CJS88_01455 [Neisseria gonorrhoeae]